MSPMRGGLMGPYLQKGEWQINGYWSRFATDETFRAYDVISTTSVHEGGDSLNLQGAYGLTRRVNLTAEVPYVLWSYWSNVVAGTRYYQHVHGFGDIVISGRLWLLDPEKHKKQNFGISMGLRLPTGESNYQVPYPDSKGKNIIDRPVYPAVQPGSGAAGIRLSTQGFRSFKHFSVYGSGLYLFSLKKQNNTIAFGAAVNPAGPQATAENVRFLSAPDSYQFSGGVSTPIPHFKRISLSVGSQIAGVPVYNKITGTSGYRQPGYMVSVNPTLAWDAGFATYYLSVPVRVHQYVGLDFLNNQRAADFAKTSVQLGVQFNLGRKKEARTDSGASAPAPK
jgi:hypothetical protein